MSFFARLLAITSFVVLVAACGGSDSNPTPVSRASAGAPTTRSPESPFTAAAVWKDVAAQERAAAACKSAGRNAQHACLRMQMVKEGAPQEAIEFIDATAGAWLLGLYESPGKLRAGLVWRPGIEPQPRLSFLRSTPVVKPALDVLMEAFPSDAKSFRPFTSAPEYAAVNSAAQRKFQNADDPFDLKHFETMELESAAGVANGDQQFVVQAGINNFCPSCGIGVAARYRIEFDSLGNLKGATVLGLCQGRNVTQDVQGVGKVTFHKFSGVAPGRDGVREPYLVLVPGLSECPEHVTF